VPSQRPSTPPEWQQRVQCRFEFERLSERDLADMKLTRLEIFDETRKPLNAGEQPLPVFVEAAISPFSTDSTEFPLVLTSAKVVHYCHGQHRNVPSLRRRATEPEVRLHPETAAERGIQESDWVEIHTPKAKVRMRAKFDAALHPRARVWACPVSMPLPIPEQTTIV
jgi:anaerobic selenocysteine-containing dehydrogenase